MQEHLNMFVEETREHLLHMADALADLSEGAVADSLAGIFRDAHTVKGMALTMGFERTGQLTHALEDVFSAWRANGSLVDARLASARAAAQTLIEVLETIEATGQEPDFPAAGLLAQLRPAEETTSGSAAPSSAVICSPLPVPPHAEHAAAAAQTQGMLCYQARLRVTADAAMPFARLAQWLSRAGAVEVLHANPAPDILEQGEYRGAVTLLFAAAEPVDPHVDGLDDVSDIVLEELLPYAAASAPATDPAAGDGARAPAVPSPQTAPADTVHVRTIRVDADKVDSLLNWLSQFAVGHAALVRAAQGQLSADAQEAVNHLGRLADDLQRLLMSIRMVPVASVFSRFPRMVRDIAERLRKDIAFEMSGEMTELDRSVVEEIAESVLHLLRNSVDHGIERPELRQERAKPAQGHIRLHVRTAGNQVIIEVEDDGGGIAREKVRLRGLELGLLRPGENPTDRDLYQLLFAPGFSTAQEVSDISGRGVGLDIVRDKIASVSGSVDVFSTEGRGTRFVIRLPVTLALLDCIVVESGGGQYLLPVSTVSELVRHPALHAVDRRTWLSWRGQTIPAVHLHDLFHTPPESSNVGIVIEQGDGRAVLLPHAVGSKAQVVVKPLDARLRALRLFSGAAIMQTGEVALILDTTELIDYALAKQ